MRRNVKVAQWKQKNVNNNFSLETKLVFGQHSVTSRWDSIGDRALLWPHQQEVNETTQCCANCWLSVSASCIPPLGGGGVGYIGIRTGQVGTGCHHSGLALCYFWQHRCKCVCSWPPQHHTLFNCNLTTVVVTAEVGFTSLCASLWHSFFFDCFTWHDIL